jgi:hypothetical protein
MAEGWCPHRRMHVLTIIHTSALGGREPTPMPARVNSYVFCGRVNDAGKDADGFIHVSISDDQRGHHADDVTLARRDD